MWERTRWPCCGARAAASGDPCRPLDGGKLCRCRVCRPTCRGPPLEKGRHRADGVQRCSPGNDVPSAEKRRGRVGGRRGGAQTWEEVKMCVGVSRSYCPRPFLCLRVLSRSLLLLLVDERLRGAGEGADDAAVPSRGGKAGVQTW